MAKLLPIIKSWLIRKNPMIYNIKSITGYYPVNLSLYKQAFTHKSVAKKKLNGKTVDNERLEFLGDAVLDTVLADFLFKKYPYKDEGFLTQLRSKVVNRKQLSLIAKSIGLEQMVLVDQKRKNSHTSIYGNAFEAFIGAIYLDRGYKVAYRYIVKNILKNHVNIKELDALIYNSKSLLLEWCQKHNVNFAFHTKVNPDNEKNFVSYVTLDDQKFSVAMGFSKKEAEQNAANIALKAKNII